MINPFRANLNGSTVAFSFIAVANECGADATDENETILERKLAKF